MANDEVKVRIWMTKMNEKNENNRLTFPFFMKC